MIRRKNRLALWLILMISFSSLANAQLSPDTRLGMDAYKKKDFTNSLVFFIKASTEGSKESMMMVAIQYARGEGVVKDSATYVVWLNKAAKAGNDYAMYSLGVMYDNGRYLPKDSILALQWYVKGAQAGNSNCQNNL